jgi:hypothetical protein
MLIRTAGHAAHCQHTDFGRKTESVFIRSLDCKSKRIDPNAVNRRLAAFVGRPGGRRRIRAGRGEHRRMKRAVREQMIARAQPPC